MSSAMRLVAALVLVACGPSNSGSKSAAQPHVSAQPLAAVSAAAATVAPSATASAAAAVPAASAVQCMEKGALQAELTTSPEFDHVDYTDESLYGTVETTVAPEVYVLKDGTWVRRPELTPKIPPNVSVGWFYHQAGEFHWEGYECPRGICELRFNVSYRFRGGRWLPTWSRAWGTPMFPHLPPSSDNFGGEVVKPIASSGGVTLGKRANGELVLTGSTRKPAMPKPSTGCAAGFDLNERLNTGDGEKAWVLGADCEKQVLVQWSSSFTQASAFELPTALKVADLTNKNGIVRVLGWAADGGGVHLMLFDGKGFTDHKLPFAGPDRIAVAGRTDTTVFERTKRERRQPAKLRAVHRVHGGGRIQSIPMPNHSNYVDDLRGAVWSWNEDEPGTLCWLGASADVPVKVELPVNASGAQLRIRTVAITPDGTAYLWGRYAKPFQPGPTTALKVKSP